MPILGLCSTESWSTYRLKNVRRSVQHEYPNGAAPLTGLLSLYEEEETNDPEFSHWEQRYVPIQTTTVVPADGANDRPFRTGAGADSLGASFTWTADTSYRVHVADNALFRKGSVVKIVATVAGVDKDLLGIVTSAPEATVTYVATPKDYLTVRATNTVASVPNASTDVGDYIDQIGSAFGQGIVDISSEVFSVPTKFTNYTQIFRTPFSMTGTALKTPLEYDESSGYREKVKQHSIQHMVDLELALLFGAKHSYVPSGSADPTTGAGLPVYTTGGILWYIQRWEAGDYGTVTVTNDASDDKRIIENTTGLLDEDTYDKYLERVFRTSNNKSNEKLVFCGNGALRVLNQMYKSKTCLNASLPMTDTYGMQVLAHTTPFGTVYYKTHPLFNRNPVWRHWMLFVEMANIKYRPMKGRDTELLKNRQPADADYRKDEWFTEGGLELWRPDSFMLIKNVQGYTP